MEDKIRKLQTMIEQSHYTVVITGAGVSTSVGISDMPHMNLPAMLQIISTGLLQTAPKYYYRLLRKTFLDAMFLTGPSITHKKLARYKKLGLIQGVITTNIDCLHTLAGSQNVAEIQGSFGKNRCLKCGGHVDDISIWGHGNVPRCPECGGFLAAYPIYSHIGFLNDELHKADIWMSHAELVIAIGAQGIYDRIPSHTKVIQINPNVTYFDRIATLIIREKSDTVFNSLR